MRQNLNWEYWAWSVVNKGTRKSVPSLCDTILIYLFANYIVSILVKTGNQTFPLFSEDAESN